MSRSDSDDWRGFVARVPPPPWHYSGDLLTVEYRTDPEAVKALLPEPLELASEDPGAVALIWADWQSCSVGLEELLDPVRSQYKECFYVVRCRYRGETYSRSVAIWVDKDFSLVRGYFQGYPKSLGEIWMTRPVTVGRAGPRLEPGGRFGASLSAEGRRLVDAELTLTGPSETSGFVNAHPMLHHRVLPAIECDGSEALSEVIKLRAENVELGPAFRGEAKLRPSTSFLPPQEIIAGYWRGVGMTFAGGTTLEVEKRRG